MQLHAPGTVVFVIPPPAWGLDKLAVCQLTVREIVITKPRMGETDPMRVHYRFEERDVPGMHESWVFGTLDEANKTLEEGR